MDTPGDKPLMGSPTKHCSGCDRDLPAIKGKYFGANRSTADGLASRCLECARAADRKRPPQHQARNARRRRKAVRECEVSEYAAGIRRSKSAANQPHASETTEDFWEIGDRDRDRSAELVASHLRACRTCDDPAVVQRAIDAVLEATADCRPCPEDLGLLTDDELGQRFQAFMASCK